MTAVELGRPAGTARTTTTLDVVVPVFNEERDLRGCVERLDAHLRSTFPYSYRITVADNASTDGTWAVAAELQAAARHVRAVHLDEKGRGRALRHCWERSDAAVLAYTDVDLSTDLGALLPLVAPLLSGHSDVAIGSRLTRSSRVVRGPRREVISRGYNLLLRGALGTGFSDAQCGFKAITRDVAEHLLPLVEDDGWFFDTELLVLAERAGLRIHEVPVDWVDDPDSRVDVRATVLEDLRGVRRLLRGLGAGTIPVTALRDRLGRQVLEADGVPSGLVGQLLRFAGVGALSTIAYVLLYVVLRDPLGAQGANLAALLVTAVANTAANRRHTFGVRGPVGRWRHQAQGLVVFAAGWAITAGSLAGVHAVAAQPGTGVELAALVLANAIATVLRFGLLRHWVFRR